MDWRGVFLYLCVIGCVIVCDAGEAQVDNLGPSKAPKYISNIEVLALSGYDMIYDHETFPIFERRKPMLNRNLVAILPIPDTTAKMKSTAFANIKTQLQSMQDDKNQNSQSRYDLIKGIVDLVEALR
eukprot:Nk52_evm10s485 gene=Nk52_evmTU10s485